MAFAIPLSQFFTGINIFAFYAPNFFQSIGFGNDSALLSAVILGLVNLASIVVSTAIVDHFGQRFLFIVGGVQMLVYRIMRAVLLVLVSGVQDTGDVSWGNTVLILVMLCLYGAGFGWSWGPLCWLIPSEIFPLEIKSAGQSIAIAVQLSIIFVLSQTFLTMLCHFKFGTFLFYAGWIGL